MDERFVPLATILRVAPPPPVARGVARARAPVPAPLVEKAASRGIVDFAQAGIVHDLALMKVAALEAFEAASRRLLRLLATDVLGRELLLAPADLEALARAAVAELAGTEPVMLVVCAEDAARVRAPLPVRIDPELGAGDLAIDVRDGTMESHFTFRLECALERSEESA